MIVDSVKRKVQFEEIARWLQKLVPIDLTIKAAELLINNFVKYVLLEG